jgi:hypothetical protein
MSTLVTEISRNPSALATGNSVVKFEYNTTRYTIDLVKHCSVALHNTWLDVHTKDHYPVGSYVDILDCNSEGDSERCETDESMEYRTTVGIWCVATAAVALLYVVVVLCVVNWPCCVCKAPSNSRAPVPQVELAVQV